MILICPSCSASYNVNASALGKGPRAVRCSSCDHQWEYVAKPVVSGSLKIETDSLQDPPQNSSQDSTLIPTSLAAAPDSSGLESPLPSPSPPAPFSRTAKSLGRRLSLYRISFLFLCLILAGVIWTEHRRLAFLAPLIHRIAYFPAVHSFSAEPTVALKDTPGTFQDDFVIVHAEHDFQETSEGPALVIYGIIANNSPQAHPLPYALVTLRDSAGAELFAWKIRAEPPSHETPSHETPSHETPNPDPSGEQPQLDSEKELIPGRGSVRFWGRMMFPPKQTRKITVSLAG